jgi:hypothetical protein
VKGAMDWKRLSSRIFSAPDGNEAFIIFEARADGFSYAIWLRGYLNFTEIMSTGICLP